MAPLPALSIIKTAKDTKTSQMTEVHQVSIITPLAVGAGAVLCTIFIHALALGAVVNFFRWETKLGRAGTRYRIDLTIVVLVMSFAFAAHLIEVAVWAKLFMICGEFQQFGVAYYHSAVNYSTLGYGDVIMSPSWRLLGPLEAADGSLMFGVSTAMIFAVILRLVETRFADLKD
ncbi:ion channel [Tunturiibacter gelidiferens]|uniref:ion channel n=1 Tax=Tunturiibacter gelidiferens TaxID=3069689 RepID=UPI003D9AD6DE